MKWMIAGLPFVFALSVFGQGPLTPPGAPGETMKSLDQIEPRIPISTATYDIVRPGSYYLTTNAAGITIQSGDVTLDLMGYSIVAVGGSAIYFYNAYSNVVIRNGTLSSAIGNGLSCAYPAANARGLVERVRVRDCPGIGMELPGGYIVRDCQIYGCGAVGIRASGAAEIRNCHLEGNGTGVIATNGSRIVGNTIVDSVADGLQIQGTGSYVAENIVRGNHGNYNLSAGNQLNLLICEIPESLDWPCTAKLAGTLICSIAASNGITVNADEVTIDFAGHALVGSGANSGHGICQLPGRQNLTLLNGKVVDWRGDSMSGVYAMGGASRLSGIQAETNTFGITAGWGSILDNCSAFFNTQRGIYSEGRGSLRDCSAIENGGYDGIYAGSETTLNRCSASYNGSNGIATAQGCVLDGCNAAFNEASGFAVGEECVVSHCTSAHNDLHGIYAGMNSAVADCTANNNTGNGIEISQGTRVSGCVANANGYNDATAAGIYVSAGQNHVEGNLFAFNDTGIEVDGSRNVIVRNSASWNTLDYDIGIGNETGTITNSPVGAGAWDNFAY